MRFAFDALFVLCLVAPPAAVVAGILLLAAPRRSPFRMPHLGRPIGA